MFLKKCHSFHYPARIEMNQTSEKEQPNSPHLFDDASLSIITLIKSCYLLWLTAYVEHEYTNEETNVLNGVIKQTCFDAER